MIDALLEAGKKLGREKHYELAMKKFEAVVRLDPGNYQAYFEMGKTCLVQEKLDAALEKLLRACALNDAHAYTRLLLGKAYRLKGEYRKAAGELEAARRLGYAEEEITRELAEVCRLSGDYGRAQTYLKEALDNGYPREKYEKETAALCAEQLDGIRTLNFQGRYGDALAAAERASAFFPREDAMLLNSLLNETEIARKKTVLESWMRSLTFTLTNRCNLACLMCETRKTPWDLPEKAKREIVSLLPSLERVMWQGGEAFLYGGFEELLDEAARYPLRQVLATNGLLITPSIAEKLVRYNVELTFSVDGMTKEVYEHIRPGACFEKVLDAIAMINELREKYNPSMRTRLNVLVMRANYRQIENFVEFARTHRFTTLFFNATGCDFRNPGENVFYYHRDAEVIGYINRVRDRMAARAREYGITLENWLPSGEFFREPEDARAPERENVPRPSAVPGSPPRSSRENALFCHAPWQRLYIDCGGAVRPDCLCPHEKSIGNLNESSLRELWNGAKMAEYRRRMIEGDYGGFCNRDCTRGRVPEKNLKCI